VSRFASVIVLVALSAPPARADRVDDLGRALASDPNWKVRMQAANVLGRLHDRRGVPALVRALSDASETVRGVAAGALGELGDPSAIAALQRAERDPSAVVRDQAQVALETLRAVAPAKAPPPKAAPAAATAMAAAPVAAAPAPATRGGARVEIGAITSRTSRLPGDLAERLRNSVTKNLSQTPGASLAPAGAGSFVLDTSVTRLTRKMGTENVEFECEVSLLLSRLPSKAIVLTTSGGATSHVARESYAAEQDHGLIIDALEGAVTGAWANLDAFFSKTSARR
jgi:HEAT repeat protein